MSAAAAKAARPTPRSFEIGDRRPVEMVTLRNGVIRMREKGKRHVYETTVANVFYSAVRSEALNDIRRRQRRAQLVAEAKGGRR